MNVKSVISLSVLTLFILFASSGNYNPAESTVGSIAPNFTVSNADTTLSLQQLLGNYVVVTFWDSSRPESRIANMQYDHIQSQFIHIGVNIDRSEAILGQLCRVDGLKTSTQFHASGDSQLLGEWKQLDGDLQSFLIDPHGTIIALNPSADTLREL